MKNTFIFLSIMVTLSACGPNEVSQEPQDQRDIEPVYQVNAVPVVEGNLIESLRVSAVVEGGQEAWVISETEGILQDVKVELGDFLPKGSPLAQVDSTLAELSYRQAQRAFETAQLEYDATRKLFDQGASSLALLKTAQSRLSGAEAALVRSKKALEDTVVTAPIAGTIASLDPGIEGGSYLTRGRQVARIVSLDRLKARVFLGEKEVQLIAPGSEVQVRLQNQKEWQRASIAAIGTGSDSRTGSYPVVIEWTNNWRDKVRSGMTVDVEIFTESENKLVIPSTALTELSGEKGVFVVRQGKAFFQELENYTQFADKTAVVSPLQAGDLVVNNPPRNLVAGAALEYRLAMTRR